MFEERLKELREIKDEFTEEVMNCEVLDEKKRRHLAFRNKRRLAEVAEKMLGEAERRVNTFSLDRVGVGSELASMTGDGDRLARAVCLCWVEHFAHPAGMDLRNKQAVGSCALLNEDVSFRKAFEAAERKGGYLWDTAVSFAEACDYRMHRTLQQAFTQVVLEALKKMYDGLESQIGSTGMTMI